jgi:hypothetical protein
LMQDVCSPMPGALSSEHIKPVFRSFRIGLSQPGPQEPDLIHATAEQKKLSHGRSFAGSVPVSPL